MQLAALALSLGGDAVRGSGPVSTAESCGHSWAVFRRVRSLVAIPVPPQPPVNQDVRGG